MVTPSTKERRMSLWDSLRERFRIGRISNREELIKTIRERTGLRKYQRAKGKTKSFLGLIRKSDFWSKSKYEDKLDFLQSQKQWKEGEESILRGLMKQGLKGKELVSEFNKKVRPGRSPMAVWVRASKLKK